MYELKEDVFYYLTLGNEKYPMPAMPEGAEKGILRGIYKCRLSKVKAKGSKVNLLGSGAILREALRAQDLLADRFGIASDVWSVTSYKELRRDALQCERWNLLHPGSQERQNYVQKVLAGEGDVFVAASDYMKLVAEMIGAGSPVSSAHWARTASAGAKTGSRCDGSSR